MAVRDSAASGGLYARRTATPPGSTSINPRLAAEFGTLI
jgi:hypothetical protein